MPQIQLDIMLAVAEQTEEKDCKKTKSNYVGVPSIIQWNMNYMSLPLTYYNSLYCPYLQQPLTR